MHAIINRKKSGFNQLTRSVFLTLGLSCVSALALATPDEIMVYTDELTAPGQFGVEQHFNYTLQGQKDASYAGQVPSHQLTQLTSEIAYGLSDTMEAAVYLPFALAPNGDTMLNGMRLSLRYIAPRAADEHYFYGVNAELGESSIRVSETRQAAELRPIIGYRDMNWLMSFNPILNMALDSQVSHQPRFEPALKITHRVANEMNAVLEYYCEYVELTALRAADQLVHTVYAVVDAEIDGVDMNFGIGHGVANTSDQWVLKGVAAFPF